MAYDWQAHFDGLDLDRIETSHPELELPDEEAAMERHRLPAEDLAYLEELKPLKDAVTATTDRYLEAATDGRDFEIERGQRLFPYGYLIPGEAAGLDQDELRDGAGVIDLYYSSLHAADDFFDEPGKYDEHFTGPGPEPGEMMAVYEDALEDYLAETDLDGEAVLGSVRQRTAELFEHLHSYAAEGPPQDEEAFLALEGIGISGSQFAVVGDLLSLQTGADRGELQDATDMLGAACHITDDLRDYRQDHEAGSPNLLMYLASQDGDTLQLWQDRYEDLITEAATSFQQAGLEIRPEELDRMGRYPVSKDRLL